MVIHSHLNAADAVGNSATCNQTVTIDNQSPAVTCPTATATINANAGGSSEIPIPNYVTMLSPTDDCTASGQHCGKNGDLLRQGLINVVAMDLTVVVNYTGLRWATVPNTTHLHGNNYRQRQRPRRPLPAQHLR